MLLPVESYVFELIKERSKYHERTRKQGVHSEIS
jgi:hypothetical protein